MYDLYRGSNILILFYHNHWIRFSSQIQMLSYLYQSCQWQAYHKVLIVKPLGIWQPRLYGENLLFVAAAYHQWAPAFRKETRFLYIPNHVVYQPHIRKNSWHIFHAKNCTKLINSLVLSSNLDIAIFIVLWNHELDLPGSQGLPLFINNSLTKAVDCICVLPFLKIGHFAFD